MSTGGKGGRFVGLTTLPPSWADCHEMWEPQTPGTLRVCPGIALILRQAIETTNGCSYLRNCL